MKTTELRYLPQSRPAALPPPLGEGSQFTPEIVLLGFRGSVTIVPPRNGPVRVVEWLAGLGSSQLRQWNCDAPVRRRRFEPAWGQSHAKGDRLYGLSALRPTINTTE